MPALDARNLRECRIRAVSGLEASLALNKPRALVQMATGAGKTFTAITAVYRPLKFGGARRVPWFWWIPAASASRSIKNSILRGFL